MRLGLVSFEYAEVAGGGGIGTYMRNVAAMMAGRGHDVEVFTVVQPGTSLPRVKVHAIEADRQTFPAYAAGVFAERHRAIPFDVIEAAEYGADLRHIANALPCVPRVVKLATATYIIDEINSVYTPLLAKARFILGGLRRRRLYRPYWWPVDDDADPERLTTLSAHEVTSPSRSLLELTARKWPIDLSAAQVIPYVYVPEPALLAIPPDTFTNRIVFIGKLEVRKGVIELARAIRYVLDAFPQAHFRFVGPSLPRPGTGEAMEAFLKRILGPHTARVEFTGGVPYERIPELLADADIATFPSYWEAYGFVCVEAMAAARGVIGSSAGGMAEIIKDGCTGRLVPPRDPRAIAGAILKLLRNPEQRMAMGRAARQQVLTAYSPDVVGPLHEASYLRAIERARARNRSVLSS